MPSRRKLSGPSWRFILSIADSGVRCGKLGFAFRHWRRSSGSASSSAPISIYRPLTSSPLSACFLNDANASEGSIGLGGVPSRMMSGFGAVLTAGTISSSARWPRICASSKMMLSTPAKPRPKPPSLAPNRMREPFMKRTSCWPFACLGRPSMYGAISGLCERPSIALNVSSAVLVRCAVQRTNRPSWRVHNAKMIDPIVYVLPT